MKSIAYIAVGLFLGVTFVCGQSYDWVTKTGGDADGAFATGVAYDFDWEWGAGGSLATGTGSITRTNAGNTYSAFENHETTIIGGGFSAPAYDNSTLANTLGGVTGSQHFLSEGELGRAANDVAAFQTSTTVFDFEFTDGQSSPFDTQITLFDPGAFDKVSFTTVNGPFTYAFVASLDGTAVDTTQWSLVIEDPYTPNANYTTTHVWDGATLTVNNFTTGSANFPDTIAYLDTNGTTFDSMTMTVNGLATDTVAIGMAANTAPVPEPSSAALIGLGCITLLLRRSK